MQRPAERFLHSILLVLGGTAAAQALPLFGSLVLARLYLPSEFGLFATWLGLVSLIAVAITGRYEMALAIERDGAPRQTAVMATLAIVTALGTALLFAAILIVLSGSGAGVPPAFWLVSPAAAVVIATLQTWQCWLAADGRFRDLSAVRISQAAAITGAQILAGLLQPTALSLALAHTAGAMAGIAVAWRRLPLQPGATVSGEMLTQGMLEFCKRQRRFPLLSLPADSVNTAAAQLPLLLVASRFGADIAGYLALSLRTLGAPIALLGTSVLDVFRRRSAQSYRDLGNCRDDYSRTFRMLAIGASIVAVPVVLAAEPLFALAFGERWRISGTIALWLLPMFALRFVASPLSYVFYVSGKQHFDLAWQFALLAMTLATLSLPVEYSPALKAYSAGYSFLYVVYLGLTWRLSKGAGT